MALKSKITDKAEFDKLADVLKAEYKEENGVWLLQSDDAEELRTAKVREKERADKAEAEAKALKKAAEDAEAARLKAEEDAKAEAARKSGDIATLEKSWEAKVIAAREEGKAEVTKLRGMLENLLVDSEARNLANEISISPSLLTPIIKARLRAELDGDTPITRVLDANGKPSAMNIAELKQELVANKEFAAIIKGSNGSGGGAGGNNSGGGAAGKKITEMTEAERIAHHTALGAEAFRNQAKLEGIPGY